MMEREAAENKSTSTGGLRAAQAGGDLGQSFSNFKIKGSGHCRTAIRLAFKVKLERDRREEKGQERREKEKARGRE